MKYRFFVDNNVLVVEPPLVKHELPRDDAALLLIGIQKWEAMASFVEQEERLPFDGMSRTCALCKVYANDLLYSGDDCSRCPVFAATGWRRCNETPYGNWVWACCDDTVEAGLAAARAEVEFLKGILESLDN